MILSYSERLRMLKIQKYYLIKFGLNYNSFKLRKLINDLVSGINEEICILESSIENYKNSQKQMTLFDMEGNVVL